MMSKRRGPAPGRPAAVPVSARVGLSGWLIGAAVWGAFAVLFWAFVTGA